MELTDTKFLEAFLAAAAAGPLARKTVERPPLPSYQAPPNKAKRHQRDKGCACIVCLDNARWERIFQEKFADPNYYAGLQMRHESPLRSL